MPDSTLQSQIGEARTAGYSDAQILGHLASTRSDLAPKIQEAQQSGHADSDVVNFLASANLGGGQAAQPAKPAPAEKPGAGTGFMSTFAPTAALQMAKRYLVDVPLQEGDKAVTAFKQGDYLGAAAHTVGSLPGAGILPDIIGAQVDQGQKARAEAQAGHPVTASVRDAVAAVPVAGPLALNISDHLLNPETRAQGVGELGGVVASGGLSALAPRVAPLLDPVRDTAADALQTSAEKNIATALHPTTKVNKALVQDKIAPGLVDRGVRATSLKDLQEQAQQHMAEHGDQIDAIFDQHADAGTTLSPKPILAKLEAEKQNYVVDGVPINPSYVAKVEALQTQLQDVSNANGGQIPLASLRKIRQIHDEVVAKSKGGFALDPEGQTSVDASRTYANGIRSSFAENVPGLADANKEFSFWSDVDKVTGDSLQRKTGQRAPLTQKILEGVGTMAGAKLGGPAGALLGNRAGGMLGQFQNSTLWNTLSASVKSRIADLVATGDHAGAVALAQKNGIVPTPASAATPAADNLSTSGDLGNGLNAGSAAQGANIPQAVRAGAGSASTQGAEAAASAPAQNGAATTITVPGQPGPGYRATYKLQELDSLNASHNGLTFAPNAEYRLTNDRNYTNPQNQGKVVNGASRESFNPSLHITDNADATNGPIVTDSAGNVIGGNGRKMILDRVYNGNPKGVAAYRDMLTQKAGQFGIDPDAIAGMKQPVLTRVIHDSEFGPGATKQDAVTDLNKTGTAPLTPGERAIADSRRVSTDVLDDVASRLDAKGADATMADVLQGKSGQEVFAKLTADGVISPQERTAFVDDKGLTKAGRDRISQMMIGRFFSDPGQLDSLPAGIRAKVERIAAPLAQVEAKGGAWNLTSDVQGAIDLLEQARTAGISTVDDFIKQDGLFGKDKYSPRVVSLAKALKTSSSADLTAAARQFAQDASYAAKGESLMGDTPTPEGSFGDSFGKLKSGAESQAAKLTAKVKSDVSKPTIMYRGAETPELGKGQFGGTFLATDEKTAGQYGPVHSFQVSAKKFLDIDDPQAEALSAQYLKQHPDDAPNYDPDVEPGAAHELWMFPTRGWKAFLEEKGFEGTSIGKDHFVFDAGKVKPLSGAQVAAEQLKAKKKP